MAGAVAEVVALPRAGPVGRPTALVRPSRARREAARPVTVAAAAATPLLPRPPCPWRAAAARATLAMHAGLGVVPAACPPRTPCPFRPPVWRLQPPPWPIPSLLFRVPDLETRVARRTVASTSKEADRPALVVDDAAPAATAIAVEVPTTVAARQRTRGRRHVAALAVVERAPVDGMEVRVAGRAPAGAEAALRRAAEDAAARPCPRVRAAITGRRHAVRALRPVRAAAAGVVRPPVDGPPLDCPLQSAVAFTGGLGAAAAKLPPPIVGPRTESFGRLYPPADLVAAQVAVEAVTGAPRVVGAGLEAGLVRRAAP